MQEQVDSRQWQRTPREGKQRQSSQNRPKVTLNVGGDNLVFYPDWRKTSRKKFNQSHSNLALGNSYGYQTMKNFQNDFSFTLPP